MLRITFFLFTTLFFISVSHETLGEEKTKKKFRDYLQELKAEKNKPSKRKKNIQPIPDFADKAKSKKKSKKEREQESLLQEMTEERERWLDYEEGRLQREQPRRSSQ